MSSFSTNAKSSDIIWVHDVSKESMEKFLAIEECAANARLDNTTRIARMRIGELEIFFFVEE